MHSATLSTRGCAAAAVLLAPAVALAHAEGHAATSAWVGFVHPLTGIDHALAMIAVGLWATRLGRTAIRLLPLVFPLAMVGGALAARMGIPLPAIESVLASSVVAFGVAVACAVRLPLVASASLVSLFAVFHGYAHFNEAPATGAGLSYGAGFIAATILLHMTGLAGGALITHIRIRDQVFRIGGAIIASTGAYLLS